MIRFLVTAWVVPEPSFHAVIKRVTKCCYFLFFIFYFIYHLLQHLAINVTPRLIMSARTYKQVFQLDKIWGRQDYRKECIVRLVGMNQPEQRCFPWLRYLHPQCAHCCSTEPVCPSPHHTRIWTATSRENTHFQVGIFLQTKVTNMKKCERRELP